MSGAVCAAAWTGPLFIRDLSQLPWALALCTGVLTLGPRAPLFLDICRGHSTTPVTTGFVALCVCPDPSPIGSGHSKVLEALVREPRTRGGPQEHAEAKALDSGFRSQPHWLPLGKRPLPRPRRSHLGTGAAERTCPQGAVWSQDMPAVPSQGQALARCPCPLHDGWPARLVHPLVPQ